ncbi:MAG TPA: carbon-nitrogen hydrolase family protein [Terriglobales bacterium]|nr:carbon-nitrogen hydrolase family protein [Terriglobales bacterium]
MKRNQLKPVRVAVIQSAPVYLDLAASVAKAQRLMREAARKGAKLVAFGETWLPGYPAWLDSCPDAALWNYKPVKQVFARLRQNSFRLESNEAQALGRTARELGLTVVMGVNERVDSGPGNGTLYNSLVTWGPDGRVRNVHRKLMPTYTERMVWGTGDGGGLEAVDTPAGRVGGLICWEHWMPLARQAMHNSGEHIHVAVWPTAHDLHHLASRHYAFEGRCYVLCVGLMMPARDLPRELARPRGMKPTSLLCRGGSAIFAPDGRTVAGPVFDREIILTADLDFSVIDEEKMTLDVSGHYARPDVFQFAVRSR